MNCGSFNKKIYRSDNATATNNKRKVDNAEVSIVKGSSVPRKPRTMNDPQAPKKPRMTKEEKELELANKVPGKRGRKPKVAQTLPAGKYDPIKTGTVTGGSQLSFNPYQKNGVNSIQKVSAMGGHQLSFNPYGRNGLNSIQTVSSMVMNSTKKGSSVPAKKPVIHIPENTSHKRIIPIAPKEGISSIFDIEPENQKKLNRLESLQLHNQSSFNGINTSMRAYSFNSQNEDAKSSLNEVAVPKTEATIPRKSHVPIPQKQSHTSKRERYCVEENTSRSLKSSFNQDPTSVKSLCNDATVDRYSLEHKSSRSLKSSFNQAPTSVKSLCNDATVDRYSLEHKSSRSLKSSFNHDTTGDRFPREQKRSPSPAWSYSKASPSSKLSFYEAAAKRYSLDLNSSNSFKSSLNQASTSVKSLCNDATPAQPYAKHIPVPQKASLKSAYNQFYGEQNNPIASSSLNKIESAEKKLTELPINSGSLPQVAHIRPSISASNGSQENASETAYAMASQQSLEPLNLSTNAQTEANSPPPSPQVPLRSYADYWLVLQKIQLFMNTNSLEELQPILDIIAESGIGEANVERVRVDLCELNLPTIDLLEKYCDSME